MKRKLKVFIAYYILSPLVTCNYTIRQLGLWPDRWFWADKLLFKWGMVSMPCHEKFKNLPNL